MRRAAWPVLLSVAVVGVLFLFVFPARTYLAQRRDLAAAESRVHVLGHQNKVLSDQAAKLQDDAEIERLARSQYGLVMPGEEAYAILPPPPPPVTAEPAPPPAHRQPRPDWATRFLHGL